MAESPEGAAASAQAKASAQAEALRVLVVDDDEAVLSVYCRVLTRAGCTVGTAANGMRAIEALRAGPYDVIVSDIQMPGGMSGIDLLARIGSEGVDTPVVLATGDPSMETAIKAVEHGVVRYLAKPVDPKLLIHVVGEAARLHGIARLKRLALDNDALRTLIEELNRSRDAAQAASRAKSEFLAKMSHELYTPLSAIMGYAELALDGELPADARDHVQTVLRSADTLLGLIRRVLDFSGIDRGELDLEAKPFDLREVLAAAAAAVSASARAKRLSSSYDVEPSVPRVVVGDAHRLRQIVESLARNAVQFTEVGTVGIRVATERLVADRVRIRVSISDTGVGIPECAMERVVEAFSQADNSTTRRYGGAGLGLTLAARLVESMKGKIEIESEANVGTTVRFSVELGMT